MLLIWPWPWHGTRGESSPVESSLNVFLFFILNLEPEERQALLIAKHACGHRSWSLRPVFLTKTYTQSTHREPVCNRFEISFYLYFAYIYTYRPLSLSLFFFYSRTNGRPKSQSQINKTLFLHFHFPFPSSILPSFLGC